MMRFAGVDLATAVNMASAHPSRLLGRGGTNLRPGDRADLVLFDLVEGSSAPEPERLEIRATVCRGECVCGALD